MNQEDINQDAGNNLEVELSRTEKKIADLTA